jgi:DNA-directed RNA polymerase subunit N
MLVPVRCFTCGSLIGDKFEEFNKRKEEGGEAAKILDELGLERYCCRRMILASMDVLDQMIPYFEALAARRHELE